MHRATAHGRPTGGRQQNKDINSACPSELGPDFDLSAPPVLTALQGRPLLVVPQKSGIGVKANGGSIDSAGPGVVDGMVYVSSGSGGLSGRPGNVLLAFGLP